MRLANDPAGPGRSRLNDRPPWCRMLALELRVTTAAVLLGLAAVSAVHALTGRSPDLRTWLALQRSVTPGAVVTSGFFDWRGVSRYRVHPGLHSGYDVAMASGSVVVAGWAGQVVAIVPWTDDQWGITVKDDDGFSTTYGHLRPLVRIGVVLRAGDPVGATVIDHVDIKMRRPDGVYHDFGRAGVAGVPPRVAALTLAERPPPVSPEALEKARLHADEYDEMYQEGAVSRNARDSARSAYASLMARQRLSSAGR